MQTVQAWSTSEPLLTNPFPFTSTPSPSPTSNPTSRCRNRVGQKEFNKKRRRPIGIKAVPLCQLLAGPQDLQALLSLLAGDGIALKWVYLRGRQLVNKICIVQLPGPCRC